MTTESFDSLVAFYEEAIPAAGLEIVETDDQFPDNRQWIFQSGDMFQGAVGISPAEGGYRASLTMLGIPPEN